MSRSPRYARVLVDVEPDHLDRLFDYAVPDEPEHPVQLGSRVIVRFAGRRVGGVVVGLADTTDVAPGRIRPLERVLGPHAWLTEDDLDLVRWAGERYAAPAAHLLGHVLPQRVVDVERRAEAAGWFPPGLAPRPSHPVPPEVDEDAWAPYGEPGARLRSAAADGRALTYWRPLPGEDLGARLVELVGLCLVGGRDALVLTPSPRDRAADAVLAAYGDLAVDVRGGPKARRAYRAWLAARCGQARVVVGERGAAFWPLERPGLLVVLDESNPAYKARRSPYHHARDVVLERARRGEAVGLLVGTVPSAIAWRLLARRRLAPLTPRRGLERTAAPTVLVDDRSTPGPGPRTRLGEPALRALRAAVDGGELGVVLAARRGEGRALACRACGTRLVCSTCGSSVAPQPGRDGDKPSGKRRGAVHCERCGWASGRQPACRACQGQEFVALAAGAERLGTELGRTFPNVPVHVLEGFDRPPPAPPAVVVTTRGSVFRDPPGPVGAVVLVDLDGMLRRPTLDAAEDALRVSMTVAAWTATTVVQTAEPQHHAVRALVGWDPGGFWRAEAALRAELRFPPAADAIRIDTDAADRVAADLAAALEGGEEVLGPLPTGDRSRLLLKTDDRVATVAALAALREAWSRDGLEVRVEVDPVESL